MNRRPRLVRAVTCVIVATVVAATQSPAAASPAPDQAPGEPRITTTGPADRLAAGLLDRDAQKVAATRHIPGFGGAYLDSTGDTLHVWLTEPTLTRATQARNALVSHFGPEVVDRQVVPRRASYSFAQLYAWKEQVRQLLARPGVVLSTIDERSNRLELMVEDLATVGAGVQDWLAARGIPAEAVNLTEGGPFTTDLLDRSRPLRAGTQVIFHRDPNPVPQLSACTMGFVALRQGVRGFVTNSHCSTVRSQVDGLFYYQGTYPTDQVGREVLDPPFFTGTGCASGMVCRFSDSNFVQVFDSVSISRGRVARPPLGMVNWNGSDQMRIIEADWSFVNDTVRKVGRTTGHTEGRVFDVCADIGVQGTNIGLRCQDLATYESAPGDSGSPVVRLIHDPNIWDGRLVGIHWGGGELSDGTHAAAFSPYPFVDGEIGLLDACAAGFGC